MTQLDTQSIEFRAWTGKKMIYQGKNIEQDKDLPCKQYLGSFIRRVVPQIIWDHDETASYYEHESYLPNGGTIDEYFMQYIRLKDKNGKKAYIDDIVRFDKPIGLHGIKIYQIVPTNSLGFSLLNDAYEYDGIELQLIPFEIIGNARENPELLASAMEAPHE